MFKKCIRNHLRKSKIQKCSGGAYPQTPLSGALRARAQYNLRTFHDYILPYIRACYCTKLSTPIHGILATPLPFTVRTVARENFRPGGGVSLVLGQISDQIRGFISGRANFRPGGGATPVLGQISGQTRHFSSARANFRLNKGFHQC